MSDSWNSDPIPWQPPRQATAPWQPEPPKPELTLDEILLRWEASKKALAEAKESEADWRRQAFLLGFGDEAKEGVNTLELNNGYQLKGVKKLTYKLQAPKDFNGDTVDAVDECVKKFKRISNEGSFIAERLFKYSVNISIEEYRNLYADAEHEATKKAMLVELNKVLVIDEGMPTLDIKAPKAAKK